MTENITRSHPTSAAKSCGLQRTEIGRAGEAAGPPGHSLPQECHWLSARGAGDDVEAGVAQMFRRFGLGGGRHARSVEVMIVDDKKAQH